MLLVSLRSQLSLLCVSRASLRLQPAVRGLGSAAFPCSRKPPAGPAAPVPSVLSVPPPSGSAGFPSCRAVSGGGAAGWYGGLADSAPVRLTEQILLSAQQSGGLPWWSSILLSTLAARTLVTLPLAAYQMVIIAKVRGQPGSTQAA
ncbi:cytochrome c oxidase assembly protein COX18, mitochondrial-like [Centroberyx affinis]|uniref:cytochrome c oxidase assembly protein COX18, mitochondrial-like n=1 Tax=Centroberyx affinis TaxID=166261 RepID=UPI003A5BE3FE